MEETKNLTDLSKSLSGYRLDSIAIIDTLKELIDGEYKEDTLLSIIKEYIKSVLKDNEQSRKLLSRE